MCETKGLIRNYAILRDEALFSQFARHGYSKDKVRDLLADGRVTVKEHKFGRGYDVGLKTKKLFSIREEFDWKAGKVTFICEDLVEPKVKGE